MQQNVSVSCKTDHHGRLRRDPARLVGRWIPVTSPAKATKPHLSFLHRHAAMVMGAGGDAAIVHDGPDVELWRMILEADLLDHLGETLDTGDEWLRSLWKESADKPGGKPCKH